MWTPHAPIQGHPFTQPTTYGTIADAGTLDRLASATGQGGKGNIEFTVVGYGLQSVKPVESATKQRMVGTVSFVNLTSALSGGINLHYSNNPGQGHGGSGGTCFGDSGGPVLYSGEIVAVNSFVLNNNCNGAAFGYRVDVSSCTRSSELRLHAVVSGTYCSTQRAASAALCASVPPPRAVVVRQRHPERLGSWTDAGMREGRGVHFRRRGVRDPPDSSVRRQSASGFGESSAGRRREQDKTTRGGRTPHRATPS